MNIPWYMTETVIKSKSVLSHTPSLDLTGGIQQAHQEGTPLKVSSYLVPPIRRKPSHIMPN